MSFSIEVSDVSDKPRFTQLSTDEMKGISIRPFVTMNSIFPDGDTDITAVKRWVASAVVGF